MTRVVHTEVAMDLDIISPVPTSLLERYTESLSYLGWSIGPSLNYSPMWAGGDGETKSAPRIISVLRTNRDGSLDRKL